MNDINSDIPIAQRISSESSLKDSILASISFIKDHKCQRCQNWYQHCKKDECLFYPVLSLLKKGLESDSHGNQD